MILKNNNKRSDLRLKNCEIQATTRYIHDNVLVYSDETCIMHLVDMGDPFTESRP